MQYFLTKPYNFSKLINKEPRKDEDRARNKNQSGKENNKYKNPLVHNIKKDKLLPNLTRNNTRVRFKETKRSS